MTLGNYTARGRPSIIHWDAMQRRVFSVSLGGALSALLFLSAGAQEGHHGVGHDKWHRDFYDRLLQKDGSSCCTHVDCRPTQSRIVGNHYEVKVYGRWVTVRKETRLSTWSRLTVALTCALRTS